MPFRPIYFYIFVFIVNLYFFVFGMLPAMYNVKHKKGEKNDNNYQLRKHTWRNDFEFHGPVTRGYSINSYGFDRWRILVDGIVKRFINAIFSILRQSSLGKPPPRSYDIGASFKAQSTQSLLFPALKTGSNKALLSNKKCRSPLFLRSASVVS